MRGHGIDFAADGHRIPQALRILRKDILAIFVEQVGERIERFHRHIARVVLRHKAQVELLHAVDQQVQALVVLRGTAGNHAQRAIEFFGEVFVDLLHHGGVAVSGRSQGVPHQLVGFELRGFGQRCSWNRSH